MKKISTILLSLLLLLALSACTNDNKNNLSPNGDVKNNNINNEDVNNNTQENGDVANNTAGNSDVTNNNTASNNNSYISRERAIEIALSHAGVTRDVVYDLEAELDKERNGVLWEVDFDTREFEYSYDINATTEEIVKVDKDRND